MTIDENRTVSLGQQAVPDRPAGSQRDLLGDALHDHVAERRQDDLMLVIPSEGEWPVDLDEFLGLTPLSVLETVALQRCRGKVLDIGAGAGRHSLTLQARGHEVHSVDRSPGAVKAMRERGLNNATCSDWQDFCRDSEQTFDTVLLLHRGLGILGDIEGVRSLLGACRRILNPDGQLLTDCNVPQDSRAFRQRESFLRYGDHSGPSFQILEMTLDLFRTIAAEERWDVEILADGYEFAVRLSPQ